MDLDAGSPGVPTAARHPVPGEHHTCYEHAPHYYGTVYCTLEPGAVLEACTQFLYVKASAVLEA